MRALTYKKPGVPTCTHATACVHSANMRALSCVNYAPLRNVLRTNWSDHRTAMHARLRRMHARAWAATPLVAHGGSCNVMRARPIGRDSTRLVRRTGPRSPQTCMHDNAPGPRSALPMFASVEREAGKGGSDSAKLRARP